MLDLHWYPEARGGGVRVTEENNGGAVVAARGAGAALAVGPDLHRDELDLAATRGAARSGCSRACSEKIAAHYPGTRLAITEYNYGGGGHISGAIAQADVLGIFGREDVFAAALWDLNGGTSFIDAAFAAYRNFDGAGGRFGDTSLEAATSDDAASSLYASVDEGRDDRLVLVAINKTGAPLAAELQLDHPVELARGETWQLTSAAPALRRGPQLATAGRNAFRLELPASSVTTLVLTP